MQNNRDVGLTFRFSIFHSTLVNLQAAKITLFTRRTLRTLQPRPFHVVRMCTCTCAYVKGATALHVDIHAQCSSVLFGVSIECTCWCYSCMICGRVCATQCHVLYNVMCYTMSCASFGINQPGIVSRPQTARYHISGIVIFINVYPFLLLG